MTILYTFESLPSAYSYIIRNILNFTNMHLAVGRSEEYEMTRMYFVSTKGTEV